ncbi:MAG: hypothetical protein JKY37_16485 [Nannocystaceae bacterium]|nr:hypothetical protein [Nannocystaceae bacterium]
MRAVTRQALLALLVASPLACGGGGQATATERLWVSAVPTDAKAPISAFATTRYGDTKFLGAFFSGTLLRGSHDVFEWRDRGKGRAQLRFLQDGARVDIRLETCEPTTGFDHCLLVCGDPTGAVKYQSRKRWVVKRPGKRKPAALVLDAMAQLAQGDTQLASWLDVETE